MATAGIARDAESEAALGAEAASEVRAEPTLGAEERLVTLARSGGALRRVLAALAVRWIDTGGWGRVGYARLADHARERLGCSGRHVQELARVGRRLPELPRLEAALASGALPWSKVRLLAGCAEPSDEARWIGIARGVAVRRLERELRAAGRGTLRGGALVRTDEDGRDVEPSARVPIRGPAQLCFKWARAREYASRTVGERLASGAVLEMVTAEALSAVPLAGEGAGADSVSWEEASRAWRESPESRAWVAASASEGDAASASAADVCAGDSAQSEGLPVAEALVPPLAEAAELPGFLRPLVEGLEDADPWELDARLRRAVQMEQRLDARVAPLLRWVASSGGRHRVRFHTLAALAREHLGMSPRKARALLRLERAGDVCPVLRAAFRAGRVSWVRAQVLVPLLLSGARGPCASAWREAWVALAQRVTVRRLEALVDLALAMRAADPSACESPRPEEVEAQVAGPDGGRSPGGTGRGAQTDRADPTDPAVEAERQTCAQPAIAADSVRLTLRAPRDVARLFRAVLWSLRRTLRCRTGRLPSEGEAFDAMLDHALESWGADDSGLMQRNRTRYRIVERDGWRCTVPGCTSRRNLQEHHLRFRSAGGGEEDENKTTLCAYHHLRGVHEGLVRIRGRAPDGLYFEIGVRSGHPPLARYRSGDRIV